MTKKSKSDTNTKRINVTFLTSDYLKIQNIAGSRNISMSNLVREWAEQGLNGQLNAQNISFISTIIREQVESVLTPRMERQIALTAKTCIQASAAAYLSAETISNLLPEELQEDFIEVYKKARKKAVEYTKNRSDFDDN